MRHFVEIAVIFLNAALGQDLFFEPQQYTSSNSTSPAHVSGKDPQAIVYQLKLRGMKGKGTGWCLDLSGGSQDNGTPIQIWECNGSQNQLWYFPSGAWKIMLAVNNNKCIDAGSMANGAKLLLWDCNGLDQQGWGYDNDEGTVYLASTQGNGPLASKCADVVQEDQQQGAPVQVWDCNGQWNQGWDPVQGGGPSPGPSPSPGPGPSPSPGPGPSPGFDLEKYRQTCVDLVNKYRTEAGLPPHTRAKSNEDCTQQHAQYDMEHNSPHAGFKAHICAAKFATENEAGTHGPGEDPFKHLSTIIELFAKGTGQHHKNQMGPSAKGLSCGFACGNKFCMATQDYSNQFEGMHQNFNIV
jgi:hypothetical protein